MIRYVRHDEIDFDKWDVCIDNAINGMFYGYSWVLDMCARTWDALVEDDYRAVMPLPYRKKAGMKYVFQPFFVQQLGVFSTHSLTEDVSKRFIDAIPGVFLFGEFSMNTYNPLPSDHPYISGRGVTHELDLIPPYGQLREKYSKNTRRNIKKALESGVFVTSHGRPEEIIQAFRQNRGSRNIPFTEKDYQVLKHVIYAGIYKGMVSLKCAYSATNDFCAGIVFFTSHNKSVWLFSGSTPEARSNSAMSLLVDEYIRENAGKEMILDFEGSADPNLARFYRGFGSEECVFLHIKMIRMPFVLKPLINLYLNLRNYLK